MAEAKEQEAKEEEAKEEEATAERVLVPKEWPGDGLPTKPTSSIIFRWNINYDSRIKCDTLHCLYLLQIALDLIRMKTNDRNALFKKHGRPDRYRKHLDSVGIITQFIDWHNENKQKNVFNGVFLEKSEKLQLIKFISKLTGLKLGPSTDIWQKLMIDVIVNKAEQTLEVPKFKLELITYGYTKLYKAEKVMSECTVNDIVILLEFENKDPETDVDEEGNPIQGVLDLLVAAEQRKGKKSKLRLEANWRQKVVRFFVDNDYDGKKIMAVNPKKITQDCMDSIISRDEVNERGKPKNNKLRGGVNKLIRELKGCYVHSILEAHKRQNQ